MSALDRIFDIELRSPLEEAVAIVGANEFYRAAERAAEELEAYNRLAKIARQILFVVKHTNRPTAVCEHGNSATYPTHGWWCDGCFGELEDALGTIRSALD